MVPAHRSGAVFRINDEALVAAAQAADCMLVMVPVVGDFVPDGGPLFWVLGEPARLDRSKMAAAVALGPERTMNQDVTCGFRMLVDIAERASLLDKSGPDATNASEGRPIPSFAAI